MKETYDERIDRVLRAVGSARPSAGMEARIVAGMVRAEARNRVPRFFSMPQFAMMFAAAGTVCAVIVAGSVTHSHHILPMAPGLHLPGDAQAGVGAASAARVAPQPVTALPKDRPRSVRKTINGRAVISSRVKKHEGVAVPKTLPAKHPSLSPDQP
jgi:hypothetical protein